MKVATVTDGLSIKPNVVYVIPPNALMSLVAGRLKLSPRTPATIGNFAVDYFLQRWHRATKITALALSSQEMRPMVRSA